MGPFRLFVSFSTAVLKYPFLDLQTVVVLLSIDSASKIDLYFSLYPEVNRISSRYVLITAPSRFRQCLLQAVQFLQDFFSPPQKVSASSFFLYSSTSPACRLCLQFRLSLYLFPEVISRCICLSASGHGCLCLLTSVSLSRSAAVQELFHPFSMDLLV